MNTSLQDKLQKFREEKLIPEFKAKLSNFESLGVIEMNGFPLTLSEAIRLASKASTPRKGRISCEEDESKIFAWVEEMFRESGIGTQTFYLSTPFRFFPWIECRVTGEDWIENLEEVFCLNFYAISSDKKKFLDVVNGEHWVDAFWCNI